MGKLSELVLVQPTNNRLEANNYLGVSCRALCMSAAVVEGCQDNKSWLLRFKILGPSRASRVPDAILRIIFRVKCCQVQRFHAARNCSLDPANHAEVVSKVPNDIPSTRVGDQDDIHLLKPV